MSVGTGFVARSSSIGEFDNLPSSDIYCLLGTSSVLTGYVAVVPMRSDPEAVAASLVIPPIASEDVLKLDPEPRGAGETYGRTGVTLRECRVPSILPFMGGLAVSAPLSGFP